MGLPACIKEFDEMAKEFWLAPTDRRQEILTKASGIASGYTDEDKKSRAQIYIKTMEKIVEKGELFVDLEIQRVEKLSTGKVSENKKNQLKDRLSILQSFQLRKKDEL